LNNLGKYKTLKKQKKINKKNSDRFTVSLFFLNLVLVKSLFSNNTFNNRFFTKVVSSGVCVLINNATRNDISYILIRLSVVIANSIN
jgi:hypothetical protein